MKAIDVRFPTICNLLSCVFALNYWTNEGKKAFPRWKKSLLTFVASYVLHESSPSVYVSAFTVHEHFLYIGECTCACTDTGTNQTGVNCGSRCAPKRTTLFDTSSNRTRSHSDRIYNLQFSNKNKYPNGLAFGAMKAITIPFSIWNMRNKILRTESGTMSSMHEWTNGS